MSVCCYVVICSFVTMYVFLFLCFVLLCVVFVFCAFCFVCVGVCLFVLFVC